MYDLVDLLAGQRVSCIDHSGKAHPRLGLVDSDRCAHGASQQFGERDSEPRGLPLRSVVLSVRKTAMHLSHAPIVSAPADLGNRVNRLEEGGHSSKPPPVHHVRTRKLCQQPLAVFQCGGSLVAGRLYARRSFGWC